MPRHLKTVGLWLGLAALFPPITEAESMYKCIANGKTNFTSNPKDAQGNCQPMELNVPQPNPVDVSRGMERLRDYEKEKQAYSEKNRKSKELDPEAQRRAQSAELAKSIAKAPLPSTKPERSGRRKRNNGG